MGTDDHYTEGQHLSDLFDELDDDEEGEWEGAGLPPRMSLRGMGVFSQAARKKQNTMNIPLMVERYNAARLSPRNSLKVCPSCGKKHSTGGIFCSNKGKGNCKDRYWNTVSEDRRERAVKYNPKNNR